MQHDDGVLTLQIKTDLDTDLTLYIISKKKRRDLKRNTQSFTFYIYIYRHLGARITTTGSMALTIKYKQTRNQTHNIHFWMTIRRIRISQMYCILKWIPRPKQVAL